MVEVRVREWEESRRWYESFLGHPPELIDEVHQFALFDLPPVKLAIKAGGCVPGSTTLNLEIADLDEELKRLAGLGCRAAEPEKISPEGYRRVIFTDPDGQRISLFQWLPAGKTS